MPARLSAAILLISLAAAPAAAQDGRSRAQRVADEIARQVEATAQAVGTVTDSVNRSVDTLRFRGPERFAVERCVPYVERYGRMRVDDVRRYRRDSWRVYGTVGGAALGNSEGWHRGYAPRAFTCTVREDGRVKLKTSRLRRY
ncbi:MAG: hypothetical protein QOJ91_1641 [Sphingomonadales bacterium]|jgi:hypothetical protein|nr:hypothetical protein [Sphingomonadales bacterium]